MDITLAKTKLKKPVGWAVLMLELALAVLVLSGTAWYLVTSVQMLINESNVPQGFFSDIIRVFLSAIIGIEVARVLITHSLYGMLDIIGLVMMRKVLTPEVTPFDILIVAVGFSVLVVVRLFVSRFLEKQSEGDSHVLSGTPGTGERRTEPGVPL